jgi:hypothetical protein
MHVGTILTRYVKALALTSSCMIRAIRRRCQVGNMRITEPSCNSQAGSNLGCLEDLPADMSGRMQCGTCTHITLTVSSVCTQNRFSAGYAGTGSYHLQSHWRSRGDAEMASGTDPVGANVELSMLPLDVLQHVLSFMEELQDLASCHLVNTRWEHSDVPSCVRQRAGSLLLRFENTELTRG